MILVNGHPRLMLVSMLTGKAQIATVECSGGDSRLMNAVVHAFMRVVLLTAERVDLANKAVVFETFKQRKTGHFRAVPIPDALVELLRPVVP